MNSLLEIDEEPGGQSLAAEPHQPASALPLGPTPRLPELPVGPVALMPQLGAGPDRLVALPAADLPTGQLCAGRRSAALPAGAPKMVALPVADSPPAAAIAERPVVDAAVGVGHPETSTAPVYVASSPSPSHASISGPVSGIRGWVASSEGITSVVSF